MNALAWLRSLPANTGDGLRFVMLPSPRVITPNDVIDVKRALERSTGRGYKIVAPEISGHEIEEERLRSISTAERRYLVLEPSEVVHSQEVHESLGATYIACTLREDEQPHLIDQNVTGRIEGQRAMDETAKVFLPMGEPFIQPLRLRQLLVLIADVVIATLWLVGAASTRPPWPLLVLGSLGTAALVVLCDRWLTRRLSALRRFKHEWVRWHMYDRDKLADERAKTHADRRAMRIGAGLTLLTGLVIAAVAQLLRVFFPGGP